MDSEHISDTEQDDRQGIVMASVAKNVAQHIKQSKQLAGQQTALANGNRLVIQQKRRIQDLLSTVDSAHKHIDHLLEEIGRLSVKCGEYEVSPPPSIVLSASCGRQCTAGCRHRALPVGLAQRVGRWGWLLAALSGRLVWLGCRLSRVVTTSPLARFVHRFV